MDINIRDFVYLHVRPHANGGWSIVGEAHYPRADLSLAAINDDEGLIEWFAEVLGFVDPPEAPEKIIEVKPDAFIAALAPVLALARAIDDEDPDQELLMDAADEGGQPLALSCGDLQRLLHEARLLGMGGDDAAS